MHKYMENQKNPQENLPIMTPKVEEISFREVTEQDIDSQFDCFMADSDDLLQDPEYVKYMGDEIKRQMEEAETLKDMTLTRIEEIQMQ